MATPKNKTAVDEAAAKAAVAEKESAEKAAAIKVAEKEAEAAKEAEAIAAAEAEKEAAAIEVAKKAAEAEAAKKQPAKALQVVAKVDSFRRGGIVFGRTETTVRLDELTTEQIEQIKGEPLLAVSEVEVDAE